MAFHSGSQFVDDPYSHLVEATKHTGNLRYLVWDTWTRPVPNLLFILAGALGIEWAFIVPCTLTMLTFLAVFLLLRKVLPGTISALAAMVFFLLQFAVLGTGYLTNTEPPFYFLLALSLLMFHGDSRGKRLVAYGLAGLLPLCRPEGFGIAFCLGICYLWAELGSSWWKNWWGVLGRTALVLAAFIAWIAASYLVYGDPFWFIQEGPRLHKISFRTGPWLWLFLSNPLCMLPRLMSSLLLPMFFVGLFSLPRKLSPDARHVPLWYVLLLFQFVVVTFVRTGPDPWDDFYGGGHARFYATTAPVFAVFIAAGILTILENRRGRVVRWGFGVSLIVMAYGLPFNLFDPLGPKSVVQELYMRDSVAPVDLGGFASTLWDFALADSRILRYLLGMLAIIVLYVVVVHIGSDRSAPRRIMAWLVRPAGASPRRIAACVVLVASIPFTFPASLNLMMVSREYGLNKIRCLQTFGDFYRNAYPDMKPDVMHQEAMSLAHFCGVDDRPPDAPNLNWKFKYETERAKVSGLPGTLFLAGFVDTESWRQELVQPYRDPKNFADRSFIFALGKRRMTAVIFEKVNIRKFNKLTGILPLSADVDFLSASTGGTVTFSLDAGEKNAGCLYQVVMGHSGTWPGTDFPDKLALLPLNMDDFTSTSLFLANTPIFSNFKGFLSSEGTGFARFNLPPMPSADGKILYFAFILIDSWEFVSNPVAIRIAP